MGNIKEINAKNWTYYLFHDTINVKDFDSNILKIDKKSYKSTDIYYVWHITIKDFNYVKVNSVNALYLIIGEVDGCIKEKNGNRYSTLVSTDKNKEVFIKHKELWDKIENLIKIIWWKIY